MTTDIICILDKSGSMWRLVDDTIGSFNQFIEDQKEAKGKAKVTLVMFDSAGTYDVKYSRKKLKNVNPLDRTSYVPGGNTALLDAVGKTLTDLGDLDKAIVLIITDGEENDSEEYNRDTIRDMVKTREEEGWQFHYLGVGIDNFHDAFSMGISPQFTSAFSGDAKGVRHAYAVMSAATLSYRDNED
jgi:uncharacterized protein with von Willebrand factor type A (vWA) domain